MSDSIKLLITDLDGTLLHDDRSVSDDTVSVLEACRARGILLAFATARSENAAKQYIDRVRPDIVISNGGALVRYHGEILVRKQLSAETSKGIIDMCLSLTGGRGEITVETDEGHFWNYHTKPGGDYADCLYTDYREFHSPTYKITAELESEAFAEEIVKRYPACETLNFRGEIWRRFAAKGANKGSAIRSLCAHLQIGMERVIAFGDDENDMEMLRTAGVGVAMGNAPEKVRAVADHVTESNNHDGVAAYLKQLLKLL